MTKGKRKPKRSLKKQRDDVIKKVVMILSVVIMVICCIVIFLLNVLGPGRITFSLKSGFYNQDIAVEIGTNGILALQPLTIKYNTNGDDLAHSSMTYDRYINLIVPENGYKLYTITARACLSDDKCTKPETATYVLGKNLKEDVTLKIININSSWNNLYDYDEGIMVGGVTYDYNEKINTELIYIPGNYANRDDRWMRDARMTVFDLSGEIVRDDDILLGISGGTSAAYDVKSLKIIIPEENAENSDKDFRLRAGSQDQFSGNIRSGVVSKLIEQSDFDGGNSSERVVVFLNGDYYGIFDKQMNYSKENLAFKYGLLNKNKVKKFKGTEKTVFKNFEIDEKIWLDLDKEKNREELEKIIDMDNYLEYYAVQILLNNTDWPMNNYEGWRYEGKGSDNKYEDGRIRFLLYDTDLIYYTEGNVKYFDGCIGDIFEFLMEGKYNGEDSSFRMVMKSEYYREKFVNMIQKLINGPFATKNVQKIIDEEAEKIEHQVKLFSSEEEYEEWKQWIELMKKAASERNGRLKAGMKKYLSARLDI